MNSECESESHRVSVNAEITKKDCCETDIVDKSISDKYIQVNVQKIILEQNTITFINDDISLNSNLLISSSKYFNDTSPPALLNNHIYLNNSIFLI